ncbi:MAG: hypothetical protein AVDCRST_MAG68-3093 [uncultured Gemmatimonadetes bacterium]|uniref:Zinc-finger domain-containing protein n=1 Tax=uncultured Gemmatimonadota bacterium TaxID=203437 RepID=A0A6J4LUV1_9BACT|nr:MAG: hypothetical protein AVDCRST_MAG68-3093 [uncultured Gemmatimonadota bacterium]
MSTHPDITALRLFSAMELPPAEQERTASHLAACPSCRDEMRRAGEIVERVRQATELPVPEGTWERIQARRAAGDRVIPPALPVAPAARRETVPSRFPRRAAAIVLACAGVASAAAAVPMLRDWMAPAEQATGSSKAPSAPAQPTTVPNAPPPAPPAAPRVAGSSIAPVGGVAAVDVDGATSELRIRVRLADQAEVEVRASGAAADAVFHPRKGRIRIQDPGPGQLEIILPREARRVTVRVNGRPQLVAEDGRIDVLRQAHDTIDSEIVLSPVPR